MTRFRGGSLDGQERETRGSPAFEWSTIGQHVEAYELRDGVMVYVGLRHHVDAQWLVTITTRQRRSRDVRRVAQNRRREAARQQVVA